MAENKLDFFSDIKDRLFLIIVGLVSVYSILPLFINQLHSIFNWRIEWSYFVFVFLYFMLPLIFYILYCSIHDYVGFLQLLPENLYKKIKDNKTLQVTIETLALMIILFYLLFSYSFLAWFGFLILYLLSLSSFFWYAFIYRGKEKIKGDVKEFIIIGCTILILFALFFINNFDSVEKNYCTFTPEIKRSSLTDYEYKDSVKFMNDATAKWKQYFFKETIKIFSQNPDTPIALQHIDVAYLKEFKDLYTLLNNIERTPVAGNTGYDSLRKIDSIYSTINSKLLTEDKQTSIYKVYEMSDFANDYTKKIALNKIAIITKSWKNVIVNLQYRGLLWLQTVIVLGLCLWLKMRNRYINEIDSKTTELNSFVFKTTYKKIIISQDNIQEAINPKPNPEKTIIEDNINQIKSFIYISILLVLPFFKKIEDKDINLDKPFINTNFQDLTDNNKTEASNIDLSEINNKLNDLKSEIKILTDTESYRHTRTYDRVDKEWSNISKK